MNLKVKLFILYLLFVSISAWLCDDAYITFRTVDNILNGFGATWNVIERVQSYTNPLMMLCMTGLSFFTRDIYFTAIFLNIVTSSIAVYLLMFKIAKNDVSAIISGVLLLVSKSFIEFSTSGLENSISFFLAAVFYFYYFKCKDNCQRQKNILMATVTFSFILINRLDLILLFFPPLAELYYKSILEKGCKILKLLSNIFAGLFPFVLWTLFAVIYYGFPFPNTFYAKLNTGIPAIEYYLRGLWHFFATLLIDPATIIILFAVLLYLMFFDLKKTIIFPLSGVIIYLGYIVKIGGDFMSGRFFTVPFFILAVLLSQFDLTKMKDRILAGLRYNICSFFLISLMFSNIYSLTHAHKLDLAGVAQESSYYFKTTSLLLNIYRVISGEGINPMLISSNNTIQDGDIYLTVGGTIGFWGYHCGPKCHIIDLYSLSDPLLSRLPADYTPIWRIGHVARKLPEGYIDSVKKGENKIKDPAIANIYENIKVITQNEIWTSRRLKTIIVFNSGRLLKE